MSKLYIKADSGISGDMLVAALLSLGASEDALRQVLNTIPVSGFTIEIKEVEKSGTKALDFLVVLDQDNHDHDMHYLYDGVNEDGTKDKDVPGHHHGENASMGLAVGADYTSHIHDSEHIYEVDHIHEADHGHAVEHHHDKDALAHIHHHEHRTMAQIDEILTATKMTDGARQIVKDIFAVLAEAESKAHQVPVDQVHFHEVGALDSIVDVISIGVCMDSLKEKFSIEEIIVPYLREGYGKVRCQHGVMDVPVPAVKNIIDASGLKLMPMGLTGEYVTPTGAAAAAALMTSKKLPLQYKTLECGIGAGKREYDGPGILEVFLID